MLKKITMMIVCAASAYALHTGEINVNESDVEVSTKFDMGQFNDSIEPDTLFLGAKFLHADKKHSADSNASIDPYLELNFLFQKEIRTTGITVGLGMKYNYTKDFMAIPLGLEIAYKIPAPDLIPMYLHGSFYYAPSVLSFSDADNFYEYRVGYDVEVIDNGRITLGYRNIDTNYKLADFNYNKSWYIGFIIGF